MQIKLTWTLGSLTPAGQAPTTLVIQHKLSSASTWTTQVTQAYSNFCTSGSCQYTYPDGVLDANKSYDFRIGTNCTQGTTSYSGVVTKLNIVCPTLNLTSDSSSVTYSFPGAVGTSVTGYVIGIYLATDSGFTDPKGGGLVTLTSVPATVTGTFSGLDSETNYKIRVTVKSSGTDKYCEGTISTTNTLPCNAASGLTACILGVDCP